MGGRRRDGRVAALWRCGQMDPVAVLDVLEAAGYTPDALETVGQHIIGAEVVGVADLAAAGLSGGDVIAVRRALDLSVSEQVFVCERGV